jgi:hypothetical protein
VFACDPQLTALFTPERPSAGRYDVCTTDARIDDVVTAVAADGVHIGPIEAVDALDAFGTAGPYDRAALARLYGGSRARVARGWRETAGGVESLTFVSPYPDAGMTRLILGTLAVKYLVRTRGL